MKDLLDDLIALQNVEIEIFKAEEGLRELPKEIDEIDSIISARKGSLVAVDEEITALEEKKNPLDAELKENQTILDAADARIKKIKTNKEYLALQREIDLAKKRKADIEEQLLTIMDKIEKKISEKERIEKSFEADRVILDEKKEKLLAQMKELEDVVGEYKGRDEKLRKDVDQSLLSKYDRIRQSKKGLAVVECIDGVCKGCHMHIPPQLFNELVRGDKLIICPTCQRMLYIPAKGQGGEE
ncbi:MAG TPA: C4-type zinc ribbon domain-containing protein [Deltaproteobacteria bacterium]|nr:C4-type zinc ribbon domain-containing protein [Deltaproteobacteria bacterium]HOI06365.1 C4-type zinc ribbon domain-containing protein [Deltaproteobacteria bacterium]